MKKTFTAKDMEKLIRNRFCPPGYAFIPQVRNGTGFLKETRTADAIAMGLWPSRGLYLNGFEIKIHRTDWIKELKDPAKAEEISQFCDFWWVVSPKEIVKVEEVPPNWGLLNPSGSTLKIIKKAELLKPEPIDKLFLAAILRRAQETITSEAKTKERYKEGLIEGRKQAESSFDLERKSHQNLLDTVKKFEETSGVEINTWWHREKIGEAVRIVLNGEHIRVKEELEGLLETAERIVTDIKENIE